MGYTTDFEGEIEIDTPLSEDQVLYINTFSMTRHMIRNEDIINKLPNPIRENVGLPIGSYGQYYVNNGDYYNHMDSSILDYNMPPNDQPGLWCHWIIKDNNKLICDGGEKFYMYVQWLQYLIDHFFTRWDKILNGKISWEGERQYDKGVITVVNNKVTAHTDDDI